VDGLAGKIVPRPADWKTRIAVNRSIHANVTCMQSEIYFLQYRLEVVTSWPESDRKRATIAAILHQLERLTSA
jgi:hypothetical protein